MLPRHSCRILGSRVDGSGPGGTRKRPAHSAAHGNLSTLGHSIIPHPAANG